MSTSKDFLDEEFLTDIDTGNIHYAGFWTRVVAALIDGIILIPFAFMAQLADNSSMVLALSVIGSILTAAYKPYLEHTRQATFGKQAMGIKVVNENLKGITINQALLRSSPWLAVAALEMISTLFYSDQLGLTMDGAFDLPITLISNLVNIAFFISVLKVGFSTLKRGLHDDLADTYCVHI